MVAKIQMSTMVPIDSSDRRRPRRCSVARRRRCGVGVVIAALASLVVPGVAASTGAAPQTFSSTAAVTSGTPPDPDRPRFAQKVFAIAEAGDTAFVAGEFTNVADPQGAPASPPQPYLAALDARTGVLKAGSAFNTAAGPQPGDPPRSRPPRAEPAGAGSPPGQRSERPDGARWRSAAPEPSQYRGIGGGKLPAVPGWSRAQYCRVDTGGCVHGPA
jgi:hypothetical protein